LKYYNLKPIFYSIKKSVLRGKPTQDINGFKLGHVLIMAPGAGNRLGQENCPSKPALRNYRKQIVAEANIKLRDVYKLISISNSNPLKELPESRPQSMP
jgi:hypothetical protein